MNPNYNIERLGIEDFIDKHGVDVGFEVFYCNKIFGYCYVDEENGLETQL